MMFMEDKVRRQLDIFLDSIALGISFSKSFLWLNSLQNIPQADELDSAEIWGRRDALGSPLQGVQSSLRASPPGPSWDPCPVKVGGER